MDNIKSIFDIIGNKVDNSTLLPIIDYILEDKTNYIKASTKFIDTDEDFLVGNSGGILPKIDFIFIDTYKFTKVADYYRKHKVYTHEDYGSIEYKKFYGRELYRRRHGMTAKCKLYFKDIESYFNPNTPKEIKDSLLHPLHITGDHYHFLNYSRILRYPTKDEEARLRNAGIKRIRKIQDFPLFVDGQYWNYKVDEFCSNNGSHLCKTKARRKGFSYMEADHAANMVNLNKDITCIFLAHELTYLTDPGATSDFIKRNLDWLENKTHFNRGYLSEKLDAIELGYKETDTGNKKFGFRSKVLSVASRGNESCAVGKDAIEITCEESGKNPNLKATLDVTFSSTEDGDVQVGIIRVFGTGGTKDANWADFSYYFYNPDSNNFIPLENIWDTNARNRTCGFFYPQIWGYYPFIDEHGNSKIIDAYYRDLEKKEQAKKTKKGSEYTIFVGQRANKPEEAFLNTFENLFSSPTLETHIIDIRYNDENKLYQDGLVINHNGRYLFKSNFELSATGIKTHDYIDTVPHNSNTDITGCIRMFHRPFRDEHGSVPDGMYILSYDTVKIDKDKTKVTTKNSLNSFKVWERPNQYNNSSRYKLCASYCGRFDTMAECDRLILAVSEYFNGKILFEAGTGETYVNFKTWDKLNRLLRDPSGALDRSNNDKGSSGYGIVIGTGDKKLDGLKYCAEWLYTVVNIKDDRELLNLHYITDLPLLLELSSYNLIGNFDRVSDFIVFIYYVVAQSAKKKEIVQANSSIVQKDSLHSIYQSMTF